MKRRTFIVAAALAVLVLSSPAFAADKLTVLLDWYVNPDHAPLVIAKEGGYFAKHNLDVDLVVGSDAAAPPKLVAAGKADVAISYQPDLMLQVKAGFWGAIGGLAVALGAALLAFISKSVSK